MSGTHHIWFILVAVLIFTFAGCAEPAAFSLSNLTIEPEVAANETVTISVSVTNTGGSQGSHDVVLEINGTEEETKSVTLAAGDSEDVTFMVTRGDAGTYAVTTEGLSGSFTVMLPISIKIETTATTWREGEPFDIYSAIEEQLVNKGIKVVSEAGEPYDAILYSEYAETKGGSYTGGGYGTNIRCNLELRDNIGNLLFEKTISGGTPSFVTLYPGQTLYSKALDNFRGKLYFKYLGEVIATNFGVGDEVSLLIQALLEDKVSSVRAEAADALGEIGDIRAVEPLIQVLQEDEDYTVRDHAVSALGEIGDARAVEPLIQVLLEDEDYFVRGYAAEALGKIGDVRAVEALTQALEDEDYFVQRKAELALEKIQG